MLLEDCDGHVFRGFAPAPGKSSLSFKVNSPTLVAQDSWRFLVPRRHVGTSGARQPVLCFFHLPPPNIFF